eukprot:364238-Chlamydomonas_euryale.AAC.12
MEYAARKRGGAGGQNVWKLHACRGARSACINTQIPSWKCKEGPANLLGKRESLYCVPQAENTNISTDLAQISTD